MSQQPHCPELDRDYVDETHIKVFRDALSYDEKHDDHFPRTDSIISLQTHTDGEDKVTESLMPFATGVETISSQSDWTPVYNKTKRRTSSEAGGAELRVPPAAATNSGATTPSDRPETPSSTYQYSNDNNKWNNVDDFSLTFVILRYPLLIFILGWTCILSGLYFLVRLSISFSESLVLRRDKVRSKLVDNLRNSSNYQEYVENAKKLDHHLGLDEWCKEDRYKYYDWRNIRRTINNLRKLRHAKRYEDLMVVLQTCVKANFAGTENPLMYSHCYFGTKKLIEKYNTEVVRCLKVISSAKEINLREKRIFFKIVNKNFGRTCLVLSGGASFCYNHFGVLRALIENDLMPKIISGTSGGGMIAAMAATRRNDELLELITPELARKMNAFGDEPVWAWVKRWWRTGARFDSVEWARKAQWWTKGSTTFEESYKKTGKILNISTVPSDIHSPTILCNYITSPSCCIWSAMLASAAVPGILNPVMLMEKTREDKVRPFSLGSKWKDGSLRTDVPLSTLNMYFNTKFSIVSQVNPHVMLWIFKNRGDIGKPIVRSKGKTFRGGFILSYLENLIKLEIIKWLKLVKEFQLFPNLLESDWSNLFLQNFGGTITLFPKIVLSDYFYILSDPTEERLTRIIKNGEMVSYPKLLFIKHRLAIERTIEECLKVSKVDIDTTANAPPGLVTNIIENVDASAGLPDGVRIGVTHDVSASQDDDDDSEFLLSKSDAEEEGHMDPVKDTTTESEYDNAVGYRARDTSVEYDDDETAGEEEGGESLSSGNGANLGFLGIRMGIGPDNISDGEVDLEEDDVEEDEPYESNEDTHGHS
jgi:predicted acylesterase/phospholipase RssA